MGQLEAAHKLKALRRDLARVKTVLREKEMARAAANGGASADTTAKAGA
jgi:hypothetical protein